jgi:putative hydrolase of the HAD superfamily
MKIDLSSIRMIFFDAAGTLFHVRGSVGEIYCGVASKYGVEADPPEVEEAFIRAFHVKSAEGIASAPVEERLRAEKRWWLEVVRQVFAPRMPDLVLQSYFEEVFEVFRDASAYELFPDTLSALERLRGNGYRLGILSNFDSRLHGVLVGLRIASYFDPVILSWDIGCAKPDLRIFQHALQVTGIPAAQTLHVGDSLSEDFEGAAAAGIRALLLDRKGAWPAHGNLSRVTSLSEIGGMV